MKTFKVGDLVTYKYEDISFSGEIIHIDDNHYHLLRDDARKGTGMKDAWRINKDELGFLRKTFINFKELMEEVLGEQNV